MDLEVAMRSSPSSAQAATESPPQEKMHREQHMLHGDVMRDIIIGFADGLTVPFALTAGLSSLGSTKIVVLGGLAELVSGSISMGLGAWLAAITDAQHYSAQEARERKEVFEKPQAEQEEIYVVLANYNISRSTARPLVNELCKDVESWIQFMMDFELHLEKPATSRAWISALTMGFAYFIGGLVPMIPYFAMHNVMHALFVSIAITAVILVGFGFTKTYFTVGSKRTAIYGALQTLAVGALAAAASYGIVRGVNAKEGFRN